MAISYRRFLGDESGTSRHCNMMNDDFERIFELCSSVLQGFLPFDTF